MTMNVADRQPYSGRCWSPSDPNQHRSGGIDPTRARCIVRRRRVAAFLLALTAFLSSAHLAARAREACLPGGLAQLQLGYTFTHLRVERPAEDSCKPGAGGNPNFAARDAVLQLYDDDIGRRDVRDQLAHMRAAGATTVRTVIWYTHVEDRRVMRRLGQTPDRLGRWIARQGIVSNADLERLRHFLTDVAAAGYGTAVVAIASVGTSDPSCRAGSVWGGCYDPKHLPLSISVMRQIVSSLRSDPVEGLHVTYDIALEKCGSPQSESPADRNANDYARAMLRAFTDSFGSADVLTSCLVNNARRALPAIEARVQLYRGLGIRPAAFAISLYPDASEQLPPLLEAANEAADELGVDLVITEAWIDDARIFNALRERFRSGRLFRLRALLAWPKSVSATCQSMIAPPYDIGGIAQALGRRDRDGHIIPSCSP